MSVVELLITDAEAAAIWKRVSGYKPSALNNLYKRDVSEFLADRKTLLAEVSRLTLALAECEKEPDVPVIILGDPQQVSADIYFFALDAANGSYAATEATLSTSLSSRITTLAAIGSPTQAERNELSELRRHGTYANVDGGAGTGYSGLKIVGPCYGLNGLSVVVGGLCRDIFNYKWSRNRYYAAPTYRTNSWGYQHTVYGVFFKAPVRIPTTGEDLRIAIAKGTSARTALYISRDGSGTASGNSYENAAPVSTTCGNGNTIDPSSYDMLVLCGDIFRDGTEGAGTFVEARVFKFKNGGSSTRTHIISHPTDAARVIGSRFKNLGTFTSIGSGTWEIDTIELDAHLPDLSTGFVAYRASAGAALRFLTRAASRAACIATADTWFGELNYSGTSDRIVIHLTEGTDPTDTVFRIGNITFDIADHAHFDVWGVDFFGVAWTGTAAGILHDMAWYSCVFAYPVGGGVVFADNGSTYNEGTGAFTDMHHYNRTWIGCKWTHCYTGVYDTNSGHSAVPVNTLIRDCYFAEMNRIEADNYNVDHFSVSDAHSIATQGVDGHYILNCRFDDVGCQTIVHYIQPNQFTTPTGGLEATAYYAAMPYPTSCFSGDNEVQYIYPTILRNARVADCLLTNVRNDGGYATGGHAIALNGDDNQCLMVNGTGSNIVIEGNLVEAPGITEGAFRSTLSYPDTESAPPIFRNNRAYVDGGIGAQFVNDAPVTHIAGVAGTATYEPSVTFTGNYIQSTFIYVNIPNIANPAHHIQYLDNNTYTGGAIWRGPSGSDFGNLTDWRASAPAGDTYDTNSTEV